MSIFKSLFGSADEAPDDEPAPDQPKPEVRVELAAVAAEAKLPAGQAEAAPVEAALRRAIEQLYENERLTDSLMDPAAQRLLGWGEQQLKGLVNRPAPVDFDQAAHQLQQLMRAINRLAGQRAELDETELVQRLLDLVEQAGQTYPYISSHAEGETDDQET